MFAGVLRVELAGREPATFWLRSRRTAFVDVRLCQTTYMMTRRRPPGPTAIKQEIRNRCKAGLLTQVSVRLHVEQHREEQELDSGDQEQGDQDDRRRRDPVSQDAKDGDRDTEAEAAERQHHPEHVEEDERV